jgi:hypothetical protein
MGCEQFFADVSRKIIALADPVLSLADMKQEMVSPPAGAYIPSEGAKCLVLISMVRHIRK